MFKDTIELLNAHPTYFGHANHTWGCMNECTSRAVLPYKITFVLSQPRCGSTLLMRLMNGACLTNMIGDYHQDFYKGILQTYESAKSDGGQYVDANTLEDKFCDEYHGSSRAREWYCMQLAVRLQLFKSHAGGWAKSATMGFGQDNMTVVKFVDMLRDLFDNIYNELKIVFLTRDHDEIVKSMHAKTRIDETRFRECLESQRQQFKQAADLDDLRIDYKDILADPTSIIKQMNPIYPPNRHAVNKIMANKLK